MYFKLSFFLSVLFTTLVADDLVPPVSAEKVLAKYGILKEGKKSGQHPELLLSDKPLLEIVASLNDPAAVIIADFANARILEGITNVIEVDTNSIEEVKRVLQDSRFMQASKVIGIGGSGSNDLAKAVGVEKDEVITIATILSTNCISTNRSVIGTGLDAISYRAATPTMTIVPIQDILDQDEATRVFWTQSGMGDYFAAISAAIDRAYSENRLDYTTIRSFLPEAFLNLDWVNESFMAYDRVSVQKIANILHESSLYDIENDSNLNRIGGEHAFYRVLIEQNPTLRFTGASHGQIVAFGTLINAKVLSEISGNDRIYQEVKSAFTKLKMPMTYQELQKLGVTKEMMRSALIELQKGTTRKSLMIDFFKNSSPDHILDTIFKDSHV